MFTNLDSTYGYYLLFKRVFYLVGYLTGIPFQFQTIHNTGLQAFVLDMDSKQYSGM